MHVFAVLPVTCVYYSFVQEHKYIPISAREAREIDGGFNEGEHPSFISLGKIRKEYFGYISRLYSQRLEYILTALISHGENS